MIARIFILFFMFSTSSIFGQVLIGEEEKPKEDSEKIKSRDTLKTNKPTQLTSSTSIYFVTNYSMNNRELTENGDLFGDTLGERANEFGLSSWSFGIGLQNKLSKHFFWDGGISWYRNGEQYLYEGVDTMFAYQNTYNYIAMPLRINACYGEHFQWSIGAGLMPQMFTGYRQDQQWETTTDSKGDETIKTKIGYNSYVISGIFNASLAMDFSNGWSLLISPEARFQLNTSYGKYEPYIHKNRSYGVTFGLLKHL